MNTTSILGLFLAFFIIVGCDSPTAVDTGEELGNTESSLTEQERAALQKAGVTAGKKDGYKVTGAPLLKTSDETQVGTSRFVRYNGGIVATIQSSQLEPGTATSLWMVVFNKPEYCSDGECGSDDLRNPDVRADLLWVDGQVIGDSGRARYFVHKKKGDKSGSIADPLLNAPAFGIEDTKKTEVHFVVRSHGPVIPGFEYEMTHTFNGCCQLNGLPDDPRLGPVGPNICSNVQFAIHLPA